MKKEKRKSKILDLPFPMIELQRIPIKGFILKLHPC